MNRIEASFSAVVYSKLKTYRDSLIGFKAKYTLGLEIVLLSFDNSLEAAGTQTLSAEFGSICIIALKIRSSGLGSDLATYAEIRPWYQYNHCRECR